MSWCDYPTFYFDEERVAKKAYRCVECTAPILAGEKHLYYRVKWDGDFLDGRQHLLCCTACVFVRDKFQGGECIGFGELQDVYKEYTGKNHEKCRAFRSLMAQIIWRERKYRKFTF